MNRDQLNEYILNHGADDGHEIKDPHVRIAWCVGYQERDKSGRITDEGVVTATLSHYSTACMWKAITDLCVVGYIRIVYVNNPSLTFETDVAKALGMIFPGGPVVSK